MKGILAVGGTRELVIMDDPFRKNRGVGGEFLGGEIRGELGDEFFASIGIIAGVKTRGEEPR